MIYYLYIYNTYTIKHIIFYLCLMMIYILLHTYIHTGIIHLFYIWYNFFCNYRKWHFLEHTCDHFFRVCILEVNLLGGRIWASLITLSVARHPPKWLNKVILPPAVLESLFSSYLTVNLTSGTTLFQFALICCQFSFSGFLDRWVSSSVIPCDHLTILSGQFNAPRQHRVFLAPNLEMWLCQ